MNKNQKLAQLPEEGCELDNWDPMEEDFKSHLNTLAIKPEVDPVSTITGKMNLKSTKFGKLDFCDHYLKYGECADGKFCARVHVEPHIKKRLFAIQESIDNKGRSCMNATCLSPIDVQSDPSMRLLVSVTSVKTPTDFLLIAPYESANFKHSDATQLNYAVENVAKNSIVGRKIQLCHEKLAAYFDHDYRIDNLNDNIYLAQVVACKIKDGRFRRALVIGLPDFDELNYKLKLIDAGIEVELPRESIYDIKAHFLSDPPMAWSCRLDIVPADGETEWSEEAINFFVRKVRSERLYYLCEVKDVLKHDEILIVDLYQPYTKESLTEMMVSAGFAERS